MNNLQDLSLDPRAGHLLGYTLDEIQSNYQEYLKDISQKKDMPATEIMENITHWYNGYLFTSPSESNNVKVYNPFSVMLYLQNKKFDNFWFDTGTPTFLMKLLKKEDFPITTIDGAKIHSSQTKSYDIEDVKLIPLLWQTGYLTIKSYNEKTSIYQLTFPNEEVRISFFHYVMEKIVSVNAVLLTSNLEHLTEALENADLKAFFETLKIFFAKIPYDLHIPIEKYYQSIFFIIMTLLGAQTTAEERTNNGRIDAVIETDSHIFIIEFKIDIPSKTALDQIKEKEYHQKFQDSGKVIILIGVQFDTSKRNVHDWTAEELA